MTNVFWIGSAFVLATALAGSACTPQECTLKGCDDGLQIVASYAAGAPVSGSYQFLVIADGEMITYDCEITFGSDLSVNCSASPPTDLPFQIEVIPTMTTLNIMIRSHARNVHLEVRRDAMPSGAGDYAPVYQPQFPNGEDCGAACENARGSITLD